MSTPIDTLERVTAKRYESAHAVALAEVGAEHAEDRALHGIVFFQIADAMRMVSYARCLERTLAEHGVAIAVSDTPVNPAALKVRHA